MHGNTSKAFTCKITICRLHGDQGWGLWGLRTACEGIRKEPKGREGGDTPSGIVEEAPVDVELPLANTLPYLP
jgi:hypothetical protein